MRAVITVVGRDKVGIIAAVSAELAALNVNILDISQTIMSDLFTMLMFVDLSHCAVDFQSLRSKLSQVGCEIGVQITIMHEDIFNVMHRVDTSQEVIT